ncbi:hypothetical protein [Nocardia pseudovaccinii]|uniref:hypothetical protein n=1 Tax=Nocardia pseudovaccinii TaxID=189540 RepID=UPI000A837D81
MAAHAVEILGGQAITGAWPSRHISHDLAVVHQIADRVVVLREGAVVETGPVAEVFAFLCADYTRNLLRSSSPTGESK